MNPAMPTSQAARTEESEEQESLLVDLAWRRLRDDIMSGRLAPDARLRVAKLRETYGIGASPLREALSRLAADGFVHSLERRGFVVAPVSLAEFRDLTDVRKLLEREALALSLRHGDDAWEAQVLAAFHRLTKAQQRLDPDDPETLAYRESVEHDFHEALVAACPSRWTLQLRHTVFAFAERYRRICAIVPDPHADQERIRDAALARDAATLGALVDTQFERTYAAVAASGLAAGPATAATRTAAR